MTHIEFADARGVIGECQIRSSHDGEPSVMLRCAQDRPEVSGRLFKPVFFQLFWLKTGLAKLIEGACPNCG